MIINPGRAYKPILSTSFSSTLDGAMVEQNYFGSIIVPAGEILTVSNRCKGLVLRVYGNLINKGTIHMNGMVPRVAGQNVGIDPETYAITLDDPGWSSLPETHRIASGGASGGAAPTVAGDGVCHLGNAGAAASGVVRTGGGGSGAVAIYDVLNIYAQTTAGAGGAGTSFGGGGGGGGFYRDGASYNLSAGDASLYQGGNAPASNRKTSWGGCGSPAGTGYSTPAHDGGGGGGGLLILVVFGTLINEGVISANGNFITPTANEVAGGMSGGGCVLIYAYNSYNAGTIQAKGGTPNTLVKVSCLIAGVGHADVNAYWGGFGGDGTALIIPTR